MRLLLISLMMVGTATAQALQISNVTYGFPGRVEIHVQPQISELDVLFVVDDSGSMQIHQQNLIKNIPALTKAALTHGVHVHAGVTTTTSECMAGLPVDKCGGKFAGKPNVADSKQVDFLTTLSRNLNVGSYGSGDERPFLTAISALSEPVMSMDHKNFYRPLANLAVVILTDADDQSVNQSPESFVNFLQGLKADPKLVSLSIINAPMADANCSKDDRNQGDKLERAAHSMNGKQISLCAPDFGAQLGELGAGLVRGVTQEIPLTAVPDMSSIRVTYGSTELVGGDIHRGWVYDSVKNLVVLGDKIDWASMQGDELIVSFIPQDWK